MKYKVIYPFFDLVDPSKKVYDVGDWFPHEGFEGELTEERINELSGKKNKLKRPVIEVPKVEEDVVKENPPAKPKKKERTKKVTEAKEHKG